MNKESTIEQCKTCEEKLDQLIKAETDKEFKFWLVMSLVSLGLWMFILIWISVKCFTEYQY